MAVWAYLGEKEHKLIPEWFMPNEEREISWKQIEELFATGLNVMLYHGEKHNVIWIDDRRFTTR